MLLGYNHNINYKDSVFHIQTEDSGIKNPHIITLLYREGVILSSKKTSYADILKIEHLEAVVEDLMKEQHKDMLRRLKSGEFDEKAFGAHTKKYETNNIELKQKRTISTREQQPSEVSPPKAAVTDIGLLFQEKVQTTLDQTADSPKQEKNSEKKITSVSLDDAILNFFGASK